MIIKPTGLCSQTLYVYFNVEFVKLHTLFGVVINSQPLSFTISMW